MREKEGKEHECESGDDDDAERYEERDVGSCELAGERQGEEIDEYCGGIVECHLFEAEG